MNQQRPNMADNLIAGLLLQAVIAGLAKSVGQGDDASEIRVHVQAADAPVIDIEALTNEPIGYKLLERHPYLDVALYEHLTQSSTLVLIQGVVASAPDLTAEELFDFLVEHDSYDEMEKALANHAASAVTGTDCRFMALYRPMPNGEKLLWTIVDLVQVQAMFGNEYQDWYDDVTGEFAGAIVFSDDRHDFDDVLDQVLAH